MILTAVTVALLAAVSSMWLFKATLDVLFKDQKPAPTVRLADVAHVLAVGMAQASPQELADQFRREVGAP